jgi:hypothetical protein
LSVNNNALTCTGYLQIFLFYWHVE